MCDNLYIYIVFMCFHWWFPYKSFGVTKWILFICTLQNKRILSRQRWVMTRKLSLYDFMLEIKRLYSDLIFCSVSNIFWCCNAIWYIYSHIHKITCDMNHFKRFLHITFFFRANEKFSLTSQLINFFVAKYFLMQQIYFSLRGEHNIFCASIVNYNYILSFYLCLLRK